MDYTVMYCIVVVLHISLQNICTTVSWRLREATLWLQAIDVQL